MVAPIALAAGRIAVQALATKRGRAVAGVVVVALVLPPFAAVGVLIAAVGGSQEQTAVVIAQAQAADQACQDAVAAVSTPSPTPAATTLPVLAPAPAPTSTWAYDEPPEQLLVDCYSKTSDTTREYLQPGAWGGYSNGAIPPSVLCPITWAPSFLLRCDAEQALEALNTAWEADHGGQALGFTSAYRDIAWQAALYAASPSTAAPPGTSNHGWALAVDFADFGALGDFSSPNYAWMKAHAAAFGFVHPSSMEPGGGGPYEPWHWEYWGAPTQVPHPGQPQAV